MNETIINLAINGLNITNGQIPLSITTITQTNWTQFLTTLLISSFFMIFFFGQIAGDKVTNILGRLRLKAIKSMTHKHVLMIKHTNNSLFNQSMIDQTTLAHIQKALLKFKGEPFDLILHTPGGEIFSTQLIARLLKSYPGEIRALIQNFSMSGGTMLTLACDKLYMAPNASLGSTDPQLGSFFKFGSAKAWDKIVKFKGNKADDQSISFDMMGKQYTKSIRNFLEEMIDFGLTREQRTKFIDFITSGDVEHAYQLTPEILTNFGFTINKIPDNAQEKLIKLITSKGLEGVTYLV